MYWKEYCAFSIASLNLIFVWLEPQLFSRTVIGGQLLELHSLVIGNAPGFIIGLKCTILRSIDRVSFGIITSYGKGKLQAFITSKFIICVKISITSTDHYRGVTKLHQLHQVHR